MNIAGFQRSAQSTLGAGYAGDFVGLPEQLNPSKGLIAFDELTIGLFSWGIVGTNQVTNNKANAVTLGKTVAQSGIVLRAQSNVWASAANNVGYSMNIDAGYSATTCYNGSFRAYISLIVAGTLAVGSEVWANTTTGAFVVGVTVEPGYEKTPYKVIQTTGSVNDLVVISNVEEFIGASIV